MNNYTDTPSLASDQFNLLHDLPERNQNSFGPDIDMLYRNYYQNLFDYGFRKITDKEHLKDLIQETFLIAIKNLHKFEKRSSELLCLFFGAGAQGYRYARPLKIGDTVPDITIHNFINSNLNELRYATFGAKF